MTAAPTGRDQSTHDRLAEALRANLAEALDGYGWSWAASDLDDIAAELAAELTSPRGVVADLVREGQAEALETAATGIDEDWLYDCGEYRNPDNCEQCAVYNDEIDRLRTKAAALRAPRGATS